jgi:hypothetical protein
VFALDRIVRFRIGRQPAPVLQGGWPSRRRSSTLHVKRVLGLLLAIVGIGLAAVAGWQLAPGGLPSAEVLLGQPELTALEPSPGAVPVHIESTPSGARVRIDGARYAVGQTPLDVFLSPGQHSLSLEHPDVLRDDRPLHVAETGAVVNVALWRRSQPVVVPIRPVYPGAALVDARFLDDGQVALVVSVPTQPGAPGRELWRLDPSTGQLERVFIPGLDAPVSTMTLSPDGNHVAYARPGSSTAVTRSQWPVASNTSVATPPEIRPEAVWLKPLDGGLAPRRIFELPSARSPLASSVPERITGVTWTPDGTRLVVISRQAGPPVRSRIFLLSVPAGDAATDSDPTELVLLPAEVISDSLLADPGGHWLALLTRSSVAPGGNNRLNLCILELQRGGTFRDLADLGSATPVPSVAPIAWPDVTDKAPDRLVFVAPAPAAPSTGKGVFDFFGLFSTLRTSTTSLAGLFMANVEIAGLETARPRRVGTATNILGPVWQSEHALYGFARRDDGMLALRSIDPTSGATHDLGVRLPATTGQGAGLAARWDTRHGRALLLAHPSKVGIGGASLQAWLVSFVSPTSAASAAH